MDVISRSDAKKIGILRYFTGKLCPRGMIAERRVSNKECLCELCQGAKREKMRQKREADVEAARERERLSARRNSEHRKAYRAKYREENRDAIREKDRIRREQNRDALREKKKVWHQKNREAILSKQKQWREKNREYNLERMRLYNRSNADSLREYNKRFRAENPHAHRSMLAKRRAAKKDRIPAWFGEFDKFVIDESAELASMRERATGIKWHVDHMIPLQCRTASGLHCGMNIQVIPQRLNQQKHNKLWLHESADWVRAL